jgi:translocation and assembly module TamB
LKKSTYLFAVISLCLFTSLLGLSWLFKTSGGAMLILKIASHHLPSEISYDKVQGPIWGKFKITNLVIKSKDADIIIGELSAQSQFKLKTKTWSFDQLELNRVQIIPHGIASHVEKSDFNLPINVIANNIQINSVKISLSKNNEILLPTLRANLVLLPQQNSLTIYNANEIQPCVGFTQNKQTQSSYFFVDIRSEETKLMMRGHQTDKLDINWALQIPHIEQFLPKSKGAVDLKGNMTGSIALPVIKGSITGKQLQFEQYQLDKISSEFVLDFSSENSTSYCNVITHHFAIDDLTVQSLNLQANGTLAHHTIAIQTGLKDQNGQLRIQGTVDKSQWSGQINSLTWQNSEQRWQLMQPSYLKIDQNRINVEKFGLINNTNKINISGIYQKDHTYSAKINIDNLSLSFLNSFLTQNQRLDGKINLTANLNHHHTKDELALHGNLSSGSLSYSINNDIKRTVFSGGKFDAIIDNNQTLQATGALLFPEGKIVTSMEMPKFRLTTTLLKNQPLKATVSGKLMSLHLLENYFTGIKNLEGHLAADYTISGTLTKPIIAGKLALQEAGFRIPKANLAIRNINLNARTVNDDIIYQGSAASGQGTVALNGKGKFEKGSLPLHMQIQGSNFLIYNTPEIKVLASPTLNLDFINNALKLSGNILIPEAKLYLRNLDSAVNSSSDIIFVESNGKEIATTPFKIASSIVLTLGDNIHLNFQGLKGQLLGQLRIEDNPAKATVAYGQLRLKDGTYTIYSTTLKIDEGALNFTGGPITNPSLDIRAIRTLQAVNTSTFFTKQEEITAGVSVIGPAKDPKTNLFSIPAGKPASDILSYLVLGVPSNSVNEKNSALLLQAASALDSRGGKKITGLKEQIQKSLGLSEMTISTRSAFDEKTQETLQHTSFVLGKYLSPKFYVNYSLDFFDHTNTLKARYLLNRFWTIQSVATMKESGIDILYTGEK